MQMMPSCDHTGVPRHFHSSPASGSASLMSLRVRARRGLAAPVTEVTRLLFRDERREAPCNRFSLVE